LGKPVYRDGQLVRLNGVFQDITEQRRTMDAIRQANADLEGFSYSVSHDLRAPLRAIDGFIEMLLEDHAGELDADGRRMFGVVQENARKMGRLIDDILAFSRAGRLALDWQRVDTGVLVQEVWASLDDRRDDHDVRLQTDDLPSVWGDPRALRQIWSNLLSNAIKFSRERHPGLVQVRVESLDDWARFTVQDNGVGFDPAYTNKLFVLFQRLHGMDEYEGTGVGLAIVKRFVEKHGGSVTATAVPDGGASFSFSIPLHEGAAGAVAAQLEDAVDLPPVPIP
jgi:signal transduction histidine kinase